MQTRTFMQRISEIFKPKKSNSIEKTNTQQIPEAEMPMLKPVLADIPLTPTVIVNPASKPVSMASSEFKKVENHDLASWGMDNCTKLNGSRNGLASAIEIVVMNYKLEAQAKEEELISELTWEINNINNNVLKLNNEIAAIREYHIPEKETQIEAMQTDMEDMKNNTNYDLNTDYGSELYTILASSKARTKEIIRKLQTKIIDLITSIDQEKNRIDTMKKQLEEISLFDENVLSRRIHIFFNGWLSGLEGIGVTSVVIDDTKAHLENYLENRIHKLLDKN